MSGAKPASGVAKITTIWAHFLSCLLSPLVMYISPIHIVRCHGDLACLYMCAECSAVQCKVGVRHARSFMLAEVRDDFTACFKEMKKLKRWSVCR